MHFLAPPLQVKTEPIADYDPEPADDASSNLFATSPPPSPILFQVESNKQQAASITVNSNTSNCTNSKTDNNHYCNSYDQVQPQQQQIPQRRSTIFELNHQQRRHQRESMISIRKDYSHKYSNSCSGKNTNPISSTTSSNVSVSTPTVQNSFLLPPSPVSSSSVLSKFRRESTFMKRPIQSSQDSSVKSPISILERYDYDKSKMTFDDKFAKLSELDNNFPVSESAISSSTRTPIVAAAKNKTPTSSPVVKKKKKTVSAAVDGNTKKKKESKKLSDRSETNSNKEAEQVKVIVAQEIVKTEPVDVKPPSVPQSPQSENINKINNKINIIFQLNNDRKNIIWHHHRRAPKKMVQKITIKEANNNTTAKIQSDDVERTRLVTAETQTDSSLTHMNMNMSNSNLLVAEPVEYLFFVDDVLLSLQQNTISFFEFNRLATLLRKGEPDFKVIDTIPRRRHDHLIDADNKFQRLCFNEQNSFPIYVEMRAKQKILDLPEMCPIAFSYCNVYYIDQRRAKFSSVHLDTVKSIINDIVYTCIPGTSYFIMAWNETSPETKSIVTGIVKYKLTPNLDLAKLASIRQFPKLNYRTKQVYCGQGEIIHKGNVKSNFQINCSFRLQLHSS